MTQPADARGSSAVHVARHVLTHCVLIATDGNRSRWKNSTPRVTYCIHATTAGSRDRGCQGPQFHRRITQAPRRGGALGLDHAQLTTRQAARSGRALPEAVNHLDQVFSFRWVTARRLFVPAAGSNTLRGRVALYDLRSASAGRGRRSEGTGAASSNWSADCYAPNAGDPRRMAPREAFTRPESAELHSAEEDRDMEKRWVRAELPPCSASCRCSSQVLQRSHCALVPQALTLT